MAQPSVKELKGNSLGFEKRQARRWDLDFFIKVIDTRTNEQVGHLLDISKTGFCVLSAKPLDLNQTMELCLTINTKNGNKQFVELTAAARWIKPRKVGNGFAIGFQWDHLRTKSKMRISQLLRFISKGKKGAENDQNNQN